MPNSDGTLTDAEFDLAGRRLYELWAGNGGRPPCRSCGSSAHYFHPALIGNRSDTVSPNEPHTRQPTVMVYCGNCGLAEYYVAKILGIQVLQVRKPSEAGGEPDG